MHPVLGRPIDICVIEDNADLNSLIVKSLAESGYTAYGVASVEAFERLLLARQPDIFVLDLNLPGEDGTSFARRLRSERSQVGIIMLTARSDMDERRRGYETGADIYMTKPSSVDELLGAVGALSRRIQGSTSGNSALGDGGAATLSRRKLLLSGPQGQVRVTAEEADMLAAAASKADGRISVAQIREVLGRDDDLTKSAIEIKIVRLRKKFAEVGFPDKAIATVRNHGYHLTVLCRIDEA